MSYRLDREEPLADGIRRITVEQVDRAIRVLANPRANGGIDEAVHEARKAFKRVRSALRLTRRVFGEKRFRAENDRFREFGEALALPRESAVAVLTIGTLQDRYRSILRPAAFREMKAHFVERHTVALWQTVERDEAVIRVSRRLRKARRRLTRLPTRDHSDLAWTLGLKQVYRRGRRAMGEAYQFSSPDLFHEWRKQAKHLRYHLDILKGSWAGELDAAARLLHDLTDVLGFHHDLTDLDRQLDASRATVATRRRREERAALRVLIDGNRISLESEALELGLRLFSRKPSGVLDRLVRCWSDWRGSA